MSSRTLACGAISSVAILSSFFAQTLIVFGFLEPSYLWALFTYGGVIVFIPPFIVVGFDLWSSYQESKSRAELDFAELVRTNKYLEHAAKILRHDMHSGINVYLPRGMKSLDRRLSEDVIQQLRLESPLQLLREGLEHTQKVYRGVKEFTNLVKPNTVIEKAPKDIAKILNDYLKTTSYSDQIAMDWLPTLVVNEPLFCTAIDNLIRNGLRYNDSEFKMVAITMVDDNTLAVIDNGRGMTQEDFERLSQPYLRKDGQIEGGSGLGLNISLAILEEHNFEVSCSLNPEGGTSIKIKVR